MVSMKIPNSLGAVTARKISEANHLALVSTYAHAILHHPVDFRGQKSLQGLPSMQGFCTW